jgi:LAS superfamily LD-carboxypeptidase LdcB
VKRFLPGLFALSYLCATIPPGMAQIIDNSQQSQSSLGTWEQTPGGGEAWVEAPIAGMPSDAGLSYNVWRAVPENASLGRTIKFGDLTNTTLPNGSQYFQDRNRSMSELLQSQGRTTRDVKIGDSSYTAGLTLGEVIEANGGQLPASLEDRLQESGGGAPSGNKLNQLRPVGALGGSLAKELIDNPVLQEIPLSELASGNFQGALDVGVQRGAQEAIKNLPDNLKDLPVGSIAGALASGDYKAAINEGISYGGKRLAEYILKDEALKNLPIGAIAKDLPISELGNITTAPLTTLPKIGSQYISKIPGLKDASVVQAGISAAITLAKGDIAVKLDVAYAGKREQPNANAFTGGTPNNSFAATNCVINSAKKGKGKTTNCAHFEMGYMNIGLSSDQDKKMPKAGDKKNPFGKGRYKGMQMVDGQTQQVKGGKGKILSKVNGGWEPTGWKPFGDVNGYNPAKLSLKNIKEYPGKGKVAEADIQLDLQLCFKIFFKTECTPHFIGVPTTFKAKQNSYLLLLASGPPPKEIQNAIDALSSRPDYCDYAAIAGGGSPSVTKPIKYGHKPYSDASRDELRSVRTGGLAAGRSESLHKDAATAYNKMAAEAKAQGIDIYAISGFRSEAVQKQLFDRQVKIQGSEEAAAKISAPPGYSEHATGYTVDLGTSKSTDLQNSFENTPAYKWLNSNAGRYGFEQSFTGKTGQGADEESWHFRFTGTPDAKAVFSSSGSSAYSSSKSGSVATARSNQSQYLARIAAGETSGGTNIGSYPSAGSNAPYGEYQFRGSTRDAVLANYPGLDAWSTNKTTRDKAALAWIGLYGNEIGVDILGHIQRGDFVSADRALGKNQFTSLPGGAEASPIWNDPANLSKYGTGGTAPANSSPSGGGAGCQNATGGGSSLGGYKGPFTGSLMNPVNGKGPETSDFGPRSSPCAGCSSNHMGVDFGVPDGTPVLAAANGKIVYQGWLSGYGNTVFVDHGNGTMTQYSHLESYLGATGSTVMQGATIALSGHSGVGTAAHLHFGVLQRTTNGNIHSGDYVDPHTMLRK